MKNHSDKILLSYSMLNETLACPHTYLNRINKMKRVTSSAMNKGTEAHDIIKAHLTGEKIQEALKKLPAFPVIERESFDPQIKIKKDLGKYEIIGYVDFRSEDWQRVGDAKTGKRWTVGDFNRLMQWRVYTFVNPAIKKFYLINTPFDPQEWNDTSVQVFNTDVTENDRLMGNEFVSKGIKIIENITNQELYYEGHHPFCWYENCEYCSEPIPAYRL